MQKKLILALAAALFVVSGAWLPSHSMDGVPVNDPAGNPSDSQLADSIPKPAVSGDEESPAPAAGPRIFILETTHDFGNISQDTKVSHKFIVKNTGDAPLKLMSARGS